MGLPRLRACRGDAVNAELVRLAIDALERVADDAARALSSWSAPSSARTRIETEQRRIRSPTPDDDDRPPVLVAPDTAAPSPPCPDVETWRAHQNFHRQQPDGAWTCAACAILAPSRLATSARP